MWGRKKREADPAVVAVKHAAPTAVIPPPVPLARGENFLAPAAPHLHTVEHKGTEIIPGAVAAGTTPVAYAGKKFGLSCFFAPFYNCTSLKEYPLKPHLSKRAPSKNTPLKEHPLKAHLIKNSTPKFDASFHPRYYKVSLVLS